jgi:hypothetical protein
VLEHWGDGVVGNRVLIVILVAIVVGFSWAWRHYSDGVLECWGTGVMGWWGTGF